MDAEAMAGAGGAGERTRASGDGPWGEGRQVQAARSPEARHGEAVFSGKDGCSACHCGILFTDQKFYTFDPAKPQRIRTPSLRNVSVTAPYWHDGSARTLEAAIKAHHGLSPLSEADEKAVETFLLTLTDEHFLHDPALALPPEACPM